MSNEFFAFGEILWDCLPSGRHAGGAPFNVATHLAQLGVPAALISTVGEDPLGNELLEVARDNAVNTRFIGRARVGLSTGTVIATVDGAGNATYELVQPAAWDEIRVSAELREAVGHSRALIFGSLAGRSPYNLDQLHRLLELDGPRKYFDVNLRRPFAYPEEVIRLAKRADLIKLNHEEVGQLATWLRSGNFAGESTIDLGRIEEDCGVLARATNTHRICVTLAAAGAALWEDGGAFLHVTAPSIAVKDTVGAGDAFMAGLVVGLTEKIEPRRVLETACRLGAYVASHHGATPRLPPELLEEVAQNFHPPASA